MKINSTPPATTGSVASRRSASAAGGSAFAGMLEAAEEGATAGVSSARGVGGIGSILAVQEVSDRGSRRRRATQQAGLTLDALDDLRDALLLGEVPGHMLRTISDRIAQQKAQTTDGDLLAVLQEIETRAAVELAKLEMALARNARL